MSYQTLAGSDAAVSVILKLRGETCDIDCLYCFEKRKEAPGGARISADDVDRLGQLFRGRPMLVELHGGEPLTAGRDHLASVLKSLAAQPSVVGVSMQTNGVLLDEEWLDLFDEVYPGLRIGISLDGDAAGNAWRVSYDAQPVYPKVVKALELLGRRGRQVGVIAVVTPAVLGRAEAVLDHLAGFDAVNAISFVPCFDSTVAAATAAPRRVPASRLRQREAVSGGSPAWAITPGQYTGFVLAAAAHWVVSGLSAKVKLEPVVSTIRRINGLDTGFCHFSDLKCDHVFTLYPEGRFGGCDELPWPAARLGTLGDGLDVGAAQQASPLLRQGRSLMNRCASCAYRSTCGGGCIATRLRNVQDEDAYCDARMRLVDGVAALLAQPSHPEGVWCRTARWMPRNPNVMNDVAAFVALWDDPAAPRLEAVIRTSAFGNRNAVGEPGVHEAADLDPRHPQWDKGIEPGVRPLVDACTNSFGAITYDSCEGHLNQGVDAVPSSRRVGVLPRDREEYALLAARLCQAVTAVRPMLPRSVAVVIGRAELTSRSSGRSVPVLDLHLEPVSGEWAAYAASVDQATRLLAEALETSAVDTSCCGCRPGSA
ncbi:radical SAM/SPASM domain-containing protein [Actinomadura rupiterrae]|uniref:radical SAM/SPASM domain-containing protein n=1 Tax=Actinomadura rupiterrae TaxID=559627 RepID=UPI0020A46625|nr:radical SAM protein [Actinomadura rupiterrae]MCP2337538.1 uncharacterized protein [Actinomadura rupiterrae]